MYNLPYAYAYALSDMRHITLVLMHILIQSPSSYKSSFSYKTSDDAETHDPSTHATVVVAYMHVNVDTLTYSVRDCFLQMVIASHQYVEYTGVKTSSPY